MNKVELLAPAGNEENFYGAINHGADAVYMGLSDFSARKNAGNFTLEKLPYFISYAHIFGVKVYIAVNTVVKNSELEKYFSMINSAYTCGVDAFIVQDVFLGRQLKSLFPDIVLHLSTQAGINNLYGAKLAKAYGFKRVILARETSAEEIREIADYIETEVFVQGALCTCLSGHCYLSSFIGGQSGNRGFCRQPCRKLYKFTGKNFKDQQRYAISLSDLSMVNKLQELSNLGVKSFKIEGRMRGFEYVCAAVDLYRKLIDGSKTGSAFECLKRAYNRGGYCTGLTFGQDKNIISDKIQNHSGSVIGRVMSVSGKKIEISSGFKANVGDCFKIIRNGSECGNATAIEQNGQTILIYRQNAEVGDEVAITKDTSLTDKYKKARKLYPIKAIVRARLDKPLEFEVNGNIFVSDYVVQKAVNAATTRSELKENARKVDIYPFEVTASCESDEGVFVPKRIMNNLRASAYEKYFYSFALLNIKTSKNEDKISDFTDYSINSNGRFDKKDIAIMATDFSFVIPQNCTQVIFCPKDYNDSGEVENFFKKVKGAKVATYIYMPAFMNSRDEEIFCSAAQRFDGIYCEGSFGIYLAKKLNKKIFGGIELNVTNCLTYNAIANENVEKIAISKELTEKEIDLFQSGYALALGDIKVMTLLYCPFKKQCQSCDHANYFNVCDVDGRVFKVRRYRLSDCRFEIYNESRLYSKSLNGNVIFDFTVSTKTEAETMLSDYFSGKKSKNIRYTSGNVIRGVE